MPIYEFRCLKCGNLFEKLFIGINSQLEIQCPKCNSDSFERVISKTNYVMKSGGGQARPKYDTKSCSPGTGCASFEIPGPDD